MVRFHVGDSVGEADARVVWALHESVFGDYPNYQTWREEVWLRHASRDGCRIARAYEHDVLVGFAHGYTGERGQWWTDSAHRVLEPDIGDAWLGEHFELVSIGVHGAARGAGIGRGLTHALVDLPHGRLLLMTTSDQSDPARRLYASEGWQVIGPGIGDATVIMGRVNGGGLAEVMGSTPAHR